METDSAIVFAGTDKNDKTKNSQEDHQGQHGHIHPGRSFLFVPWHDRLRKGFYLKI